MKSEAPPGRGGAQWQVAADAPTDSRRRPPRPDPPPIEVHILADDVVVEHEVPAIELLQGRAQGPGRLGDLMRSARRPW